MGLVATDNFQDDVSLNLKIRGEAFDEGIAIHLLTGTLTEIQAVFDKTYLALVQKKKLTREEREKFKLVSHGIRHRSIESDLGIILTGVQTTFPFIGLLGPKGIWDYTKSTYQFLKIILEALNRKQQPQYSFSGDGSEFNVITGAVTQTFNAPVFNIGASALGHYQNLAKIVDREAIDSIDLGSTELGHVVLPKEEAKLFILPSEIDDTVIQVDGEIFDFNKYESTGKLRVLEDGALKRGNYAFEVIGNQDETEYIEAMLEQRIQVSCVRELTSNPFSGEKVVKLQIMKIRK